MHRCFWAFVQTEVWAEFCGWIVVLESGYGGVDMMLGLGEMIEE